MVPSTEAGLRRAVRTPKSLPSHRHRATFRDAQSRNLDCLKDFHARSIWERIDIGPCRGDRRH
jgi:hypothetical protein